MGTRGCFIIRIIQTSSIAFIRASMSIPCTIAASSRDSPCADGHPRQCIPASINTGATFGLAFRISPIVISFVIPAMNLSPLCCLLFAFCFVRSSGYHRTSPTTFFIIYHSAKSDKIFLERVCKFIPAICQKAIFEHALV